MIRRGKTEGWLKLPNTELPAWAVLNGVTINNVAVDCVPGHEERGSAVISRIATLEPSSNPLMIIPGDLVLSSKTVERQARYDTHLQELLTAVGDFAEVGWGLPSKTVSHLLRSSRRLVGQYCCSYCCKLHAVVQI